MEGLPTQSVGSEVKRVDRLKSLLADEFPAVEKVIRDFQDKATSLNPDAGYEVKRACDYFIEDTREGFRLVMEEMQAPDYQPDEYRVAVMEGDYPDQPLIGHEPPAESTPTRNGRVLNPVAELIEVAGEPVVTRSEAKKQTKKARN